MCEEKGKEPMAYVQPGAMGIAALAMMGLLNPGALLFGAGLCFTTFAVGSYLLDLPTLNREKIGEVLKAINYGKAKEGNLPVLLNKDKSDTHLVYELKPGMCPNDFRDLQERFNSHLKAETEIYANNGQLHIRVMDQDIPDKKMFKVDIKPPEDYILPIPIGYSREGFLWTDLAELPHLVVAGETYGGKSNFLHQAIYHLIRNKKVKLHVVDLKKVEFGYLKEHAQLAMALPDACRVLEGLCLIMMERMELLYKKGRPNIKETGSMDYHVLIIDEMSQLSPVLASEPNIKQMRKEALQMLTDLLCLARALGIHVIVSTQRPDKDILPGQLKANIPAALCFKVKNEANSRIVLDNNKADLLPRIKGRAIWQWDKEREIQVQHLPVWMARKMLPKVPITKPVQVESSADGSLI